MNKLKLINSILVAFVLTTFVFVPINSYSVEYSNRMITTNDSPYDISMQYQIRDKHQNLICVVESSVTSFFDSNLTHEYLESYPTRELIKKNNQLVNYVHIEDLWRVGEGDSFLSAVKHIVKDEKSGNLIPYFFANANGCAVEPDDMVTVHWKIFYS